MSEHYTCGWKSTLPYCIKCLEATFVWCPDNISFCLQNINVQSIVPTYTQKLGWRKIFQSHLFFGDFGWFIASVCYITRDDLQLRRDFHSVFAKITARKLHNTMFSCKIYSVGGKEFALGFFLITEKIKHFYAII